MGKVRRAPTNDELKKLQSLTDAAMREGAWGMSTGLQYVPGAYADTDELGPRAGGDRARAARRRGGSGGELWHGRSGRAIRHDATLGGDGFGRQRQDRR